MTTVDFHDYDPAWPARFASLTRAWDLPPGARADHVGSTAVPGLAAKNCIDILIRADAAQHDTVVRELERHGYEERPGFFADDPERRFARLVEGDRRVAHVHLTTWDHPAARAMLAVGTLLRADDDWHRRYDDIKRSLATAHPDDRGAYIDGKDAFVVELTDAAVDRLTTLRKRKLPTLGGLTYEAFQLDSDDDGTWLLLPTSGRWSSPRDGGVLDRDVLVLLPSDNWVAWFVPTDDGRELRVDVSRAPVRDDDGWSFVDLELDVIARPDAGEVTVVDQADLAEQLAAGSLSPAEAVTAEETAARVANALGGRTANWAQRGWERLRSVG